MTHIKFWHVLLLMILIPYLLGSKGCPDNKTDTPPPPTGCGVGDGYYGARIIDGPPSDFYCDLLCCFEIEFEPKMNYTYSGFNRFYFQLKKGSSVYRSNYVQFDSGNWDNQTVEWGGCLENGEYKVTTIMENIQLNSTCEDSIYRDDVQYDYATVDIEQLSSPDKTMQIEYSCQESDTSEIEKYDVFLAQHTEEYIDIAYNVANTTYNLTPCHTDLEPKLISDSIQAIRRYIYDNKYSCDKMFLCGVKGFKNIYGNFLTNNLGYTPQTVPPNFTPNCSTGSLVAVKACINVVANKYKIDYNDFITATTIHELAWQRAIGVNDTHASEFCISNVGLVVDTSDVPINRYSNPHFCDDCIAKIKNVSW